MKMLIKLWQAEDDDDDKLFRVSITGLRKQIDGEYYNDIKLGIRSYFREKRW
jgi:hypothetical protein